MAVQSRSDLTRRYISVTGTILWMVPILCVYRHLQYNTLSSLGVNGPVNSPLFHPKRDCFSAVSRRVC